jgi:TetR/AcrR family transcriptional regulator, transcriptional repressor of aconitase
VPKVSAERKAERREQILDGAQRAFARYGFEGATVSRLEEETGLSRGAIFNYFGSKDELFIELCRRDAERMSTLFVEGGVAAVLHAILDVDPDWYAVYLELTRRLRTDERFRERIEARAEDVRPVNRARIEQAQREGEFRDDLTPQEIGAFLNLVLGGLAVQRVEGEDPLPSDLILRLLDDAIGGRTRQRRPSAKRAAEVSI